MAKRNVYQETSRPILKVLYVLVVIGLVAALVFMYRNYKIRRGYYAELVRQASSTEVSQDIASNKPVDITPEDASEIDDAAVEQTDAPEVELPSVEAEVEADAEARADSDANEDVSIPETDALVDESLAEGID